MKNMIPFSPDVYSTCIYHASAMSALYSDESTGLVSIMEAALGELDLTGRSFIFKVAFNRLYYADSISGHCGRAFII